MSDNRKSSVWPWIISGLVMLLILYVTSAGPLVWLLRNNVLTNEVSETIVMVWIPLQWLYEHVEPVKAFLNWYLSFWQ